MKEIEPLHTDISIKHQTRYNTGTVNVNIDCCLSVVVNHNK